MTVSQTKSRIWKAKVSEEIKPCGYGLSGRVPPYTSHGKAKIQFLKESDDEESEGEYDIVDSVYRQSGSSTTLQEGLEVVVYNSTEFYFSVGTSIFIIQDQYGINWVLDNNERERTAILDSDYEPGETVDTRFITAYNNSTHKATVDEYYNWTERMAFADCCDVPNGTPVEVVRDSHIDTHSVQSENTPNWKRIDNFTPENYIWFPVDELPVTEGDVLSVYYNSSYYNSSTGGRNGRYAQYMEGGSNTYLAVAQRTIESAPEYDIEDNSSDSDDSSSSSSSEEIELKINYVLLPIVPLLSSYGVVPKSYSATGDISQYGYDSDNRQLSTREGLKYSLVGHNVAYTREFITSVTYESGGYCTINGTRYQVSTPNIGGMVPDIDAGDTIDVCVTADPSISVRGIRYPVDVPDGTVIYGTKPTTRHWKQLNVMNGQNTIYVLGGTALGNQQFGTDGVTVNFQTPGINGLGFWQKDRTV